MGGTPDLNSVRTLLIGAFVLVVLLAAGPALAYDELSPSTGKNCPDCHGLESGYTSPTVAPTRKGPHGGYSTGTQKCQTCHSVHDAPSGVQLLPASTIKDTCNSCHDGSGGHGVYGVLAARGLTPASDHSIESTNVIPGGAADGGSRTATFSATGGLLTCSDCHSPHDASTVDSFTSDRARASGDLPLSETATNSPATDHLLKRQPTSANTSVTVYGSGWCGTCHIGRLSGSAGTVNHPVETETAGFDYDHVQVVTTFTASTTTTGTLGGSNRGYVMPTPRTTGQNGHDPICQQCHEDARNVGDVTNGQLDSTEAFTVQSLDGTRSADNPRFQVFPHESENEHLLVETGDDLCLNCHPPPSGP